MRFLRAFSRRSTHAPFEYELDGPVLRFAVQIMTMAVCPISADFCGRRTTAAADRRRVISVQRPASATDFSPFVARTFPLGAREAPENWRA